MTQPTRNLYVDLDGVLVDFYNATSRILGAHYKSLPPGEAWGRLQEVDHLFLGLPMLSDAKVLWEGIQGRGLLHILTATPQPTGKLHTAPGDKREWVRKHICDAVPVIVVGHGLEKAKWARPGDVLIDDLPRNIDAWVAAGGTGILHRNAESTLKQLAALG